MRIINDYYCPECQKTYERLARITDTVHCRVCNTVMNKLMPNPSGSGNAAHGFMARKEIKR